MKKASLNALSTAVVGDHVYVLMKEGERLLLLILSTDLEVVKTIWSTKGNVGYILKVGSDYVLTSIDDKLYLIKDGEARVVLVASNPRNIFWHLAEVEGKVFIHEYGLPPTAIYSSKDLERWEKIITNLDIDKRSKHFHYITFYPYRNWLITTLGDACFVRVAISSTLGNSWQPLYKGSWQFLPIFPLRDYIVFGMDSGIAKGGIGVYYPEMGMWKFIFLKWLDKTVRFVQMNDLKLLNNGLWIVSLGTPQVILVSRDLKTFHPLSIEGLDEHFNHNMMVSEGNDFIVCSTGKSLLLFKKSELEKSILTTQPVIASYKAYVDRLKGYGFLLKRKLLGS
jgi:hypothetical protein